MNIQTTRNILPRRNYVAGTRKEQTSKEIMESAIYDIVSYLGLFNDLTDSVIRDTVQLIRESNLYKQEIKRDCNLTLHAFEARQKFMLEDIGKGRDFWFDWSDDYQKRMMPHVNKLYLAVHQRMLRDKVEGDAIPMLAWVLTSHILLLLAAENYRVFQEIFRKDYGVRCESYAANMLAVKKAFAKVSTPILGRYKIAGHDKDPQVRLAIKVISEQAFSNDLLSSAGVAAIKENPDKIPEDLDINPDNLQVVDGQICDPTK